MNVEGVVMMQQDNNSHNMVVVGGKTVELDDTHDVLQMHHSSHRPRSTKEEQDCSSLRQQDARAIRK